MNRAKASAEIGRYPAQVRASRAYLAGFGTAGSLLAGASILFVLATAVVSFRGWPQVGDQSAPVSVGAAQPTQGSATVSPIGRRLVASTAPTPRAAGGAGVGGVGGSAARPATPGGAVGGTGGQAGGSSGGPSSGSGGSSGYSAPSGLSGCSSCGTQPSSGSPISNTLQGVTTTVNGVVGNTGSSVQRILNGLSGGLKGVTTPLTHTIGGVLGGR